MQNLGSSLDGIPREKVSNIQTQERSPSRYGSPIWREMRESLPTPSLHSFPPTQVLAAPPCAHRGAWPGRGSLPSAGVASQNRAEAGDLRWRGVCGGRTRDRGAWRRPELGGRRALPDPALGPAGSPRLASPRPPSPETSQSGGLDPAPHHRRFATKQSTQQTPPGEKRETGRSPASLPPPRPSPPGAPAPGWGSELQPGAPHPPPRARPLPARGGGGPTARPPRPPPPAAAAPAPRRPRPPGSPPAARARPRRPGPPPALHGCARVGLVPARGAHRADQRHPRPEPAR